VATLGLLLAVCGTRPVPKTATVRTRCWRALCQRFCTVRLVWVDGGDVGRLVDGALSALHLAIAVVKRSVDTTGFVVLAPAVGGPPVPCGLVCGVDGSGTLGAR